MSLDNIYQCSIGDYAKYHGVSIAQLIAIEQKDLALIQKGKTRLFAKAKKEKRQLTWEEAYIVQAIHQKLAKKRKHISRLEKWGKNED